jgi:hypothetical protein
MRVVASKQGRARRAQLALQFAISAHQVLATSVLTVGSMQKPPANWPRYRFHERLAVMRAVVWLGNYFCFASAEPGGRSSRAQVAEGDCRVKAARDASRSGRAGTNSQEGVCVCDVWSHAD